MKELTKGQALAKSRTAQRSLNATMAGLNALASVRDQAVYQSQEAGATYAEIQEATGLSTARVTQVLRKVREAMTTTTD